MSHYTVAVFTKEGQNVETLLAPFDENIEMEKYVKYTKKELIEKAKNDIHKYATEGAYAEYLKDPEKYQKECNNKGHLNYVMNEFPKKLQFTDEEHYQDQTKYYEKEEIGENGEIYSTYNPMSKWDWYQIGGRWDGVLKLKNKNRHVNSAKIKNIDFKPNKEAYDDAIDFWEVVVEGKKVDGNDENQHSSIYNPQYYIETYKTKEQYAKIESMLSTYAVLTPDGVWHSPGDMGWFGTSSEEPNEWLDWNINYKERFIDSANPEWTLTIVDCHI